jgi:hypothetical protein
MPLSNLPDKNNVDRKIIAISEEGLITIWNSSTKSDLNIDTYLIEQFDLRDISLIKNGVIANQIVRVIESARNIGFEQGRAFVRNALGLKD